MGDNVFSLEVLPAKEGDCLLLRYGSKDEPKLALIDGGPRDVYLHQLERRLRQLREEQEQPLILDWIMVSHVDSDHTTGVIDLTDALVAELPERTFVTSERLWHNMFDHLVANDVTPLVAAFTAQFGPAALDGYIAPDAFADQASADFAKVIKDFGPGAKLRDNAVTLGMKSNADGLRTVGKEDCTPGLLVACKGGKAIDVGAGLTFRVIGPMDEDVERLRAKYDEWLNSLQQGNESLAIDAFPLGNDDVSPSNLSSIVVLAEFDEKKILFTGDARGDKILEGMDFAGLGDRLHVDVLKSQHHGSDRNVTQAFFARVTADHYVFSGDGKHGNPERETLDMLRQARPDAAYEIYLTYPVEAIDARHESERGVDWVHEEHSLVAFFDRHPDMMRRLVKPTGDLPRHRINLLADPGDPTDGVGTS